MVSNKKIQLSRSTGFLFVNICNKYFYEEKIMLNKLPKRACPELAEGFNRSFIVSAPHATKL